MTQPDFNGSFENFREKSKAYAAAIKAFHAEDSFKDSIPETRRALDAVFEVVFETAVIFGALAPQQAALVMRERPAAQLHALHAAGTRRELKAACAKPTGVSPSVLDYGVAAARMVLSRPVIASLLDAEVQEELLANQALPPLITRRAPRG